MHQPDVAPASQLGTREQSSPHSRTPQATKPGMSLKIATTPEEREAIYRLRYEIYAVENGFRPPGSADYHAWEDAVDSKAVHLYATTNGEIVGALRTLYGADAAIPNDLREAYELARFAAVVPLEKNGCHKSLCT
jgi:putative hemolysin